MESTFEATPEALIRVPQIRAALFAHEPLDAIVVGAGKSGLAAARLLVRYGARVHVMDDRAPSSLPHATLQELGDISQSTVDAQRLSQADLVVLSPGFPRRRQELCGAIERGVLVGELELGAWFVRAPIVAITGTNGKSTTTALVAHLIECSGRRVFAGGNLGRPLCEAHGEDFDVVVVEASSYQLESLVDARFAVACWLNLTPDHADRYASFAEYAAAKTRILEQRTLDGVAVLNADDPVVVHAARNATQSVRWFSMGGSTATGFGRSPSGRLVEHWAGTRLVGATSAEREDERYDVSSEFLIGAHNRANMLAAVECARLVGADPRSVQAGLHSFRGLPHRIQLVRRLRGVSWFNDSKATNVDSTKIALLAVNGPKILIAGGRDKGAPWQPLRELAQARQVRAALLIGEAQSIAADAFVDVVPMVERVGTLERAIARAATIANDGDAVLLSPACASFDQFKNYEERGDVFCRLVRAIPPEMTEAHS